MSKVYLCRRCQRPIAHAGYCTDCQVLANTPAGAQFDHCSHCGATMLSSKLWRNLKTQKTYCVQCLEIFTKTMKEKGFSSKEIREIMAKDFKALFDSN